MNEGIGIQPFTALLGPTNLACVAVLCNQISNHLQSKCMQKLKGLVDGSNSLVLYQQNQIAT
jgi:hypothetical protein